MRLKYLFFALLIIPFYSCKKGISVEKSDFGSLSSGDKVSLYKITNSSGAFIEVMDYGCRILSINVPDRNGKINDIVVGYDKLKDFETGNERFFGAIVGRYGNRIDSARFFLDGKRYELTPNETLANSPIHLHGGDKGFDRVMWKSSIIEDKANNRKGVLFERLSPDGEEGYPGNMNCKVKYWWSEDNVLKIEYEAVTDKPTIVNMSNHTFFNLKGYDGGYVLDHVLKVNADSYLPNTDHFVPKGGKESVKNTPFDMMEPHRIDYAIDIPNEHYNTMKGFSVCWVLNKKENTLSDVADLYAPQSGRGVKVFTTEPGLLTYTGRAFDNVLAKNEKKIEKFGGMLLETLHYADSPNRSDFPSTVLRTGEKYYSTTEFHFYVK